MTVVGFDFGTTNSLISLVRGGRTINFLDEDQRPIPSVVCYEGARTIVGRDARERLAQAGLGIHGNIVRSPKMYLGRDSVFVEGTERRPVEIVADVVQHVRQTALKRPGLDAVTGAVVTIPVDMQGYQRKALRDAFRLAGVPIVQFVHEPLAALYGFFRTHDLEATLRRYDKKLILVFDWGGGTLDLTLCRLSGNTILQLMNDGTEEVGGDVFDETIMNRLIQDTRELRDLDATVEMQQGAEARLIDRCERAKIDLSSRSRVTIYVGSFFRGTPDEEFDYDLDQQELETIVRPLVDKGLDRIARLLDDAGYSPEQVALCLATGGMSAMPAIRRRLHELFGPDRVHVPEDTATLIAEGAAWIAADRAGLQLAKNVELELARNSFLPLVKAGTEMPKEGEIQSEQFHLYCTDPRDGTAKFQLCTPRRPGSSVLPNEPRIHLQHVTIGVDDKAQAFHERLELDIRINDDLILQAHARSLNRRDEDRGEVHNLEFGLRLPAQALTTTSDSPAGQSDNVPLRTDSATPFGSVSIRSNVSARDDPSLVPGEFLYEYDPHYFDVRLHPPPSQVREKLYYQACLLCGRSSNDPACKCASGRPGSVQAM